MATLELMINDFILSKLLFCILFFHFQIKCNNRDINHVNLDLKLTRLELLVLHQGILVQTSHN